MRTPYPDLGFGTPIRNAIVHRLEACVVFTVCSFCTELGPLQGAFPVMPRALEIELGLTQ